jgi:homopolymeric O-antigen transport system ATP-binding protein
MSDVAILAEGLGKEYRIGIGETGYKTLRDTVGNAAFRRLQALKSVFHRKSHRLPTHDTIWALKDVSFRINAGEVVGVIGRNGAGKSTLLKILSRITEPSGGFATIHGRIGSLLEVGTGFHPELTGRENIVLNGAILGMSRAEIQHKFEEIVEFAEIRKFVDTPVKHYSSGMYLRLAFAVAAHLETEILLVDEVLAVGDAAFQRKCLGKMGEVADAGRTVLFVSHNMSAVTGLCNRAIWIDGGRIVADGDVNNVTQSYLDTLSTGSFNYFSKRYDLAIENVVLKNSRGETCSTFYPGDELVVEVWFDARDRIDNPAVWLLIESLRHPCFAANMILDGNRPGMLSGPGRLVCRFKSLPLLPQSYTIKMAVRARGGDAIVPPQHVASFNVACDLKDFGFKGEFLSHISKSVPVILPYEWILPDGSVASVDLTGGDLKQEMVGLESLRDKFWDGRQESAD